MAKKSVCIGINDYPGTNDDLSGCVNDMNDWAEILSHEFGFDAKTLENRQATASAIKQALVELVTQSEAGDVLAFTFSGHGTYVLDGPSPDESDNRDEALCAYDEIIIDDEIRGILGKLTPGAHLTIISDSCHSGGVTRAMLHGQRDLSAIAEPEHPAKPRFLPMENHTRYAARMVPVRNRVFQPDANMNHVLLTGCKADEYSWDAYLNGRYNGAMTAHAIALIRQSPKATYKALHSELRQYLPSLQFSQTPQLEGPEELRDRVLFS